MSGDDDGPRGFFSSMHVECAMKRVRESGVSARPGFVYRRVPGLAAIPCTDAFSCCSVDVVAVY